MCCTFCRLVHHCGSSGGRAERFLEGGSVPRTDQVTVHTVGDSKRGRGAVLSDEVVMGLVKELVLGLLVMKQMV